MLKIDVIEEKENPFLKRKDLMLTIEHKGLSTPKKDELEKQIAEKYKTDPQKVEIIYIFSQSGIATSKIKARIWEEKIIEKPKKKEKVKEEPEKELPKKEMKEVEEEKKDET